MRSCEAALARCLSSRHVPWQGQHGLTSSMRPLNSQLSAAVRGYGRGVAWRHLVSQVPLHQQDCSHPPAHTTTQRAPCQPSTTSCVLPPDHACFESSAHIRGSSDYTHPCPSRQPSLSSPLSSNPSASVPVVQQRCVCPHARLIQLVPRDGGVCADAAHERLQAAELHLRADEAKHQDL